MQFTHAANIPALVGENIIIHSLYGANPLFRLPVERRPEFTRQMGAWYGLAPVSVPELSPAQVELCHDGDNLGQYPHYFQAWVVWVGGEESDPHVYTFSKGQHVMPDLWNISI